jgi:hypothetical protein
MSCLRANSGPAEQPGPGARLPGDQPSGRARRLRTDHHHCGDLGAGRRPAHRVDRVPCRTSMARRADERDALASDG